MANPTVFVNGRLRISTSTGSTGETAVGGVKEITVPISRVELADSVMGDNLETVYPGAIQAPISIVLRKDYTSDTGEDERFWNLWNNRTAVRVKVAPVNTTIASNNPELTWSRVFVLQPGGGPSGAWGASLESRIELRPGSGCTLARATSS